MDIFLVVDGLGQGIQSGVTELGHLLLTEGLALLGEQLGEPLSVQVARVVRVQGAEGGQ